MPSPRQLKAICADAVARAAFVLPSDSPREVFEDYLSADWKDGSGLDGWVELAVETGVHPGRREAAGALADMFVACEPGYPWGALESLPSPLVAWEVWCFCVARWSRHNDMSGARRLPAATPLDHRHAYATTGPSSSRPGALRDYIRENKASVPRDWLALLVRPEMWRRPAFAAWAALPGWPSRTSARMLATAAAAASAHDNIEAIGAIIDVADGDPDIADLFWHRMETEGAHRAVIASYRRSCRA